MIQINLQSFFEEFGNFLKEGICTDIQWKAEIAKLLRYESSNTDAGKVTSLESYISRMKPDQNAIYFLNAPNRAAAESSPYYEGFKKREIEVLFLYQAIDDFVMSNAIEFQSKKLLSIETSKGDENPEPDAQSETELLKWMKDILGSRVSSIRRSDRLVTSPAIIVDHESATFRRMMRFADPKNAGKLPKQILEVNLSHPIILKLDAVRGINPILSGDVAHQIMDNAMIAAGLMDDARTILPRVNRLMEAVLQNSEAIPKE